MRRRYAQYMSEHGGRVDEREEQDEYRYHRMRAEAELREIENEDR